MKLSDEQKQKLIQWYKDNGIPVPGASEAKANVQVTIKPTRVYRAATDTWENID